MKKSMAILLTLLSLSSWGRGITAQRVYNQDGRYLGRASTSVFTGDGFQNSVLRKACVVEISESSRRWQHILFHNYLDHAILKMNLFPEEEFEVDCEGDYLMDYIFPGGIFTCSGYSQNGRTVHFQPYSFNSSQSLHLAHMIVYDADEEGNERITTCNLRD